MGTSDGIDTEDWDRLHAFAVDVVNADADEPKAREDLLQFLDALEAKYGSLPSILATRADYLDPLDPSREELLLRAYDLALDTSDNPNCIYVSQSLAELYLERSRAVEADRWLMRMRSHLPNQDTLDYREYERLRTAYRALAVKRASKASRERST